jgi:hypothetical protein
MKINGAGILYANREIIGRPGSGNYDGTLTGFKGHSFTFNSGDSTNAEILFMAYGHDYAIDDIVMSDS